MIPKIFKGQKLYSSKVSRDYLDKIINSIADPIFVKDSQHRWVLLNDAFAGIFGIDSKEMLGKSDYDYFPKEEADVFWKKDELVFRTGQENVNEEAFTDAKGAVHIIITKKTLYTDNKRNKFIVGIIRDVTELKKTEKKLKQALEIKSKFTSMVSHELRTPLAAIKTGISLVSDGMAGEISGEQKEFLDIAKKNLDRLTRLINDVLDFHKLEAGNIQLRTEDNDLNEVAKEVYEIMSSLAKEKGLKLSLELDNDLPRVNFDKDRIIQALSNLVNNSIKFTDKGEIRIITKQEQGNIHLKVSDTGIGIEKKGLLKVFHSFEQLDRTRGGKVEGTGLGLAICKEIIERHKGKIWVESKVDKGSTFHFSLPLRRQ